MAEGGLYTRFVGSTVPEVRRQKLVIHEQICARRETPSRLYPSLPWRLEDLPGTTWRNVHTAQVTTVRCLGKNRSGVLGPDPEDAAGMFSIGLWRDVGFCIEHWVRVDVLSAEEQIAWARERVAVCRVDLCKVEDKLRKVKKRLGGTSYVRYGVKFAVEKLDRARQELTALCEQLGVGLDVDILNVGIGPGEQWAF